MTKHEIKRRMNLLFEQALVYLHNNKLPPASLVVELTKLKLKLR